MNLSELSQLVTRAVLFVSNHEASGFNPLQALRKFRAARLMAHQTIPPPFKVAPTILQESLSAIPAAKSQH